MHTYLSHLSGFSRNARLFLLGIGIMAFGTAAPTVLLPLYFKAIGGDERLIGAITAAIQIGGALTVLPSILLLDRIGRLTALIAGALISLLAWCGAMIVTEPWAVLGLMGLHGAANALFGLAVVPILAESSVGPERNTLFSTHEGLMTLAIFGGSLIAGQATSWLFGAALSTSAASYRTVLLGSALIRMCGLIPMAFMRFPRPVAAAQASTAPGEDLAQYLNPARLLRLKTPIALLAIPWLLAYFAGSLVLPFLPLFLRERHGAGDGSIGQVIGLINLSIGVCSLLGPLVVNRIGRSRTILLGSLLSGLGILALSQAPTLAWAAAAAVIRAGVFNLTLPLYRAFVIDQTPRHEYTIVSLLLSLSANIGPAVAPVLSGFAQHQYGIQPMFWLAAALYAAAAGVLALLFNARRTSGRASEHFGGSAESCS